MARVACIIVNYRNTADTIRALASLAPVAAAEDLRVVVVDNAADHTSDAMLRSFVEFPVDVVSRPTNLGFAGGVNRGVHELADDDTEFIWLLNSDAVVEPNCLSRLLQAATETPADIVGPLICYDEPEEKIWWAGGRWYRPWFIVQHLGKGRRRQELSLPDAPAPVQFVCGCSMLIRRSVFDALAGFDESLFLYAEDLDFCLRAHRGGYRLYLQPTAVVRHKVSQASGGEGSPLREYYLTRNSYVMIARYERSLLLRGVAYGSRIWWDGFRITRSLGRLGLSPRRALQVLLAALSDFWRQRLGEQRHQWLSELS